MRIAFFSRVFPPQTGGVERFAIDLVGHLAAQGHQVTVVGPPAAPREADRGRPYDVVRTPSAAAVRSILRRADVVHVNGHSLRGEFFSLLARHRPLITHHGYQAICPAGLPWSPNGPCTASGDRPGPCSACPNQGLRATASTRLHALVPHLSPLNVCVSRYVQERSGLPRSRVIHNPVGPAAFDAATDSPGEDNLVAFAGRLVEEKGLDVLLNALAMLPNVVLTVAGDGPRRAAWEALTASLGLTPRVTFLGNLNFAGVAALYARASVVCVPSLAPETFGYAVAEAMAMGRPIVANQVGAFSELLEDERGFLCPETTAPALAEALRAALQSPTQRAHRGARARAYAQQSLTLTASGAAYECAYADMAGGW